MARNGRLGAVGHGVGRKPAAAAVASERRAQPPAPRDLVAVERATENGVRAERRPGRAVARAEKGHANLQP